MLDTTLWIAQALLALFFLAAGAPKMIGRGLDRWTGFEELGRPLTVLIGVAEASAALALAVPLLAGDHQWLTVLAALGLTAISLMASGFHIRASDGLGDTEGLCAIETALWASLAGAVAFGRWNELSTGSSISVDLLAPVIVVLMVGVIVNLVVVARRPAPSRSDRARSVRSHDADQHVAHPQRPSSAGR